MSGNTNFEPLSAASEEARQAAAGPVRELEAVYDIPVQISAVLGRATMQVSQLLKLGRGAVVELDASSARRWTSTSTTAWSRAAR